jgi:hypothetical protein
MPEELINSMGGDVKVFNGAMFVADVTYSIHVYQRFVDAGGGLTPGTNRFHLTILSSSRILPVDRAVLTLQMEGDNKLKFFMTSPGTAQTAGGIFQ